MKARPRATASRSRSTACCFSPSTAAICARRRAPPADGSFSSCIRVAWCFNAVARSPSRAATVPASATCAWLPGPSLSSSATSAPAAAHSSAPYSVCASASRDVSCCAGGRVRYQSIARRDTTRAARDVRARAVLQRRCASNRPDSAARIPKGHDLVDRAADLIAAAERRQRKQFIVARAQLRGKQQLGLAGDAQFLVVASEQVIGRRQAVVTPTAKHGRIPRVRSNLGVLIDRRLRPVETELGLADQEVDGQILRRDLLSLPQGLQRVDLLIVGEMSQDRESCLFERRQTLAQRRDAFERLAHALVIPHVAVKVGDHFPRCESLGIELAGSGEVLEALGLSTPNNAYPGSISRKAL